MLPSHRSHTREALRVVVAVVWFAGLLLFAPYWHAHGAALVLWIVGGLALMPALSADSGRTGRISPPAPRSGWRPPAASRAVRW